MATRSGHREPLGPRLLQTSPKRLISALRKLGPRMGRVKRFDRRCVLLVVGALRRSPPEP